MQYNIRYTLDYQLLNNFNDLDKYLINSDYFDSTDEEIKIKYKKRNDGIKIKQEFDNTGFHLLDIPARKVVKTISGEYPVKCPLCLNLDTEKSSAPYNLEKALLWRNYIIKANTFPYFKKHYLLQSPDHIENLNRGIQNDVHTNPLVIEDILEFVKLMKSGTVLFNGYIGNSLTHLHFHYTDTHFPVKRKIKSYSINKDQIKTNDQSIINLYTDKDNNCKNFVLIKGKNPKNDIYKLLQFINDMKLLYNLLIYIDKDILYTFVFIRKKDTDELNFNLGAAAFGGLVTFSKENLELYKKNKRDFIKIIENYCSKTLIKIDIDLLKKVFN